ncbi:MAG TPA: DUF3450 domain-containing protein [Woeseiaceae bacterium]|nr:DUF3450 domain-containing protein [Woeseiaceae bacterium]
MKRCISSSRKMTTALVTAAVIFVTGSVVAQTVDQALQAEQRRIQLAQASQERINTVVEGTRSLEDQYRAINKEIDGLRVYNRLMTAQTEGQQAALDDIALSMDQVDVINRQIFPLMERMIDGLEQSIALDVPFLLEERNNRVETLKEIMQRSDVSVAEKFRKVMEAYQIENDYGSSSETYTQSLDVEGSPRNYNMLRVGRVGLYFQSDDARVSGFWDPESKAFTLLGNEYRNEIRKGIRMAKDLIAPELLLLPVPASSPAGESM